MVIHHFGDPSLEKLFSTAELARMWNVSESTVKRWADGGELRCIKTPGGHRRFALEDISRFQQSQGFDAVGRLTPEVDPGIGDELAAPDPLEMALERKDFAALSGLFFHRALDGNVLGLGMLLARSYLRGVAPADIYERILTPAMHRIGDLWRKGELSVADEHLATGTVIQALTRLQPDLMRRPDLGRTAVVGCPEGELHAVAIRCLAFLLDLEGWKVVYLGMNTPFFTFHDAVDRHKPDLVCISATHMIDLDRQVREYQPFFESTRALGTRVVLGGAGFSDRAVLDRFPHDWHARDFRDALRFAAGLAVQI